ncbi:MAG TPA: hydroxymethylglutaryl-CoA reductase, partial [Gammaproteobacteria bacterium]|nr:hydroxymethylglutaryl-CoA reductase [Gammaproteobacteria bacterium]
MSIIPSMLLKQLYTFGSLKNVDQGVQFTIKNRLSDAEFVDLQGITIDGKSVPRESIRVDLGDGTMLTPDQVASGGPISFPLRKSLLVRVGIPELELGKHKVGIAFKSRPFGALKFEVEDAISEEAEHLIRIPRDANDDYDESIIHQRQKFAEEFTGAKLQHITKYSFDPHVTKGNIEHFTGVMQIPLGLAGPITIRGEHAQGDFLIPLATSEGTLVASYNRGI